MKKRIVFFFALISFAACDLTKLEPAQTKSFIKYFGDVGKTYGEDLLKLDDGYLLLGNNYANEDLQGHNFSVLVKTDMNGNTMWTQIHEDIEGRSLAKTGDGYFIVGDGINDTNSTISTMMLIKTNLEGTKVGEITALGDPAASYHGTAITISSGNEVIVSGYIEPLVGSDEIFIYGYPIDLSDSDWDQVATFARDNVITARSIQEVESNDPGNPFFVSTLIYNAGTGNALQAFSVRKDALTPGPSPDLLEEFEIAGEIGSSTSTAITQTVINEGSSAIVFAETDDSNNDRSPVIISPAEGNYTVNSLVRTSDNNYVVLGSTDDTGDDATRQDTDYFIKKIGYDGTEISNGFTLSFGGKAEEYGTKIIEADDGGYVFIGTHENPNEVDFMVLVKITKDGKLIN